MPPSGTSGKRTPDTNLDLQKAPKSDIERFQRLYGSALEEVLKDRMGSVASLDFEGELRRVLAEAEKILGPELAEELEPAARMYLERALRTGQAVRGIPRAVQTVFDRPRKEAVDWLVKHDRFYLGKVFPSFVRDSFRDTVTQGLEEGLGRKAIGRRIRSLMMGKPGVPGKAELYNRVVAANVARAHNWGSLFSLEAAEIEIYIWRSVLDERTCSRCAYFDGKEFRTAPAMEVVRKALGRAPEAMEELSPWPAEDRERNDFYIKAGERRQYIKGKSTDWLQSRGMGQPPLHPLCRCCVQPKG
jgi:hypothetical protein